MGRCQTSVYILLSLLPETTIRMSEPELLIKPNLDNKFMLLDKAELIELKILEKLKFSIFWSLIVFVSPNYR